MAGKAELGAAVHAVKYRIRVKGSDTVVAESLEAGEEFVMENGGLIKAFGVALKEMKKGETASLIVAPECEQRKSSAAHSLFCPRMYS